MHWLTLAFLAALASQLAVHAWLARRQIAFVSAHQARVPNSFAATVSPADHERAARYTVARQRLAIAESLVGAAVLLWLTLGHGMDLLRRWIEAAGAPSLASGTMFVLGVLLLMGLAGLPLAAYRTFHLESRFGFNRTTPRTFLVDLIKGLAVSGVLGGTLVALILWIMEAASARWWLVAWAAWVGVTLLLAVLGPRVIAPLFNVFTPLQDAALQGRIEALLARCGFAVGRVFVMDGSRRSSHGNAYFTGLGRTKRVVFFDTLLTTLTHGQVESVLAHELAHFKLRHIPQRLLVGVAASFIGFAALGWLAEQPWLHAALGISTPSNAATLLLFVLVAPVFTWPLAPLAAAWSRRHEYQADAFASQHSSAADLADALTRLYRDNASTLTPDPLYSAFHDSHPPPVARIERLRSACAIQPPAMVAAR